MSERVPMPTKRSFVTSEDVAASVSGPDMRFARRFSLDVGEEALRGFGPHVCELVAERLAVELRHEYQAQVADVVRSFLQDRVWAEPLIKEVLREAVHAYVAGIFGPLEERVK